MASLEMDAASIDCCASRPTLCMEIDARPSRAGKSDILKVVLRASRAVNPIRAEFTSGAAE